MSAGARAETAPRLRSGQSMALPRWSGPAWGVIGVTAIFIGATCWWLTQDRSIPVYDAGAHLERAIHYHDLLQAGDLLGPFNHTSQYQPLALVVGALAAFIGGVNVASPIIGENLVFVSLLALGCYRTGRLLFTPRAGLLAAIFALGSPLLIAQFHVFMLDAPETALVAVSMWLLLASDDFSRTNVAALAGLAVGCGLLVKVQFPLFLVGIVLAALIRGGWRYWRGLVAFAVVALVVGAPWYVDHLSELSVITSLAGTGSGAAPGSPPILSMANFTWYLWSTVNDLLFAPLFTLVLGGAIWTIMAVARRREARGPRLEFVIGGFVGWLAITLTPHHDIRYDMPLMPYLAVIGTGWIVYLPRIMRLVATGVLLLAVAANTLATTFGVGKPAEMTLASSPTPLQVFPTRIVFYSNSGFLVAGPQRDGDVPGLLRALRHDGVAVVTFDIAQSSAPDFSAEGLFPLAMIAGLSASFETTLVKTGPKVVTLIHGSLSPGAPPTCTRLSDGTGVWVARRNPVSSKLQLYCPLRRPSYYE